MSTPSALIATLLLWAILQPAQDPQADEGKTLFARRCSGCHAADIDEEGPRLRGVYGRKVASLSHFSYSDSLKKLNFRWNEPTLDQWLTNPEAMAPNTDMAFRLDSPDERKAVIAYLKTISRN